jgi:hypothetical protein
MRKIIRHLAIEKPSNPVMKGQNFIFSLLAALLLAALPGWPEIRAELAVTHESCGKGPGGSIYAFKAASGYWSVAGLAASARCAALI